MQEKILLTQDQLDALEEELKYMVEVKRVEIIQRIKEAKSFGDLSENSEYDSAREEQGFTESRILDIENMIKNAEVISAKLDTKIISLGNKVTFEDLKSGKKVTYKIVGINADPLDKKEPTISAQTPIAKELLGKARGDVVEVELPKGKRKIKVVKIL